MAAPLPLNPADPVRLGPYEVVGRLGTGGQGVVFLGRDEGGRRVAIKLLHTQLLGDRNARARFVRELALLQRVAGFCTAKMIDADVAGDQPYIVSEYVRGPSLRELVHADGPRAGADLDRLAISSVTALTAIHRTGIVHRDFKPQNVLMGPDGPRVIDFGIARALDAGATVTSQVVGTPAYMAPEQFSAAKIGPSADLHAWAATLLFAATGTDPFAGGPLPAVMYRVLNETPDLSVLPPQIAEVAAACLAKDPQSRPSSEEALLWLLGDHEPPADRAHPQQPPPTAADQSAGHNTAGAYTPPDVTDRHGANNQPVTFDQPPANAQPTAHDRPGGHGQAGAYGSPGGPGPPGAYDRPAAAHQPGVYEQPGAYGQPGEYDQPAGYGQPGAYEAPGAYGQPAAHEPPGAAHQPGGYDRPGAYGQPMGSGAAGAPGVYEQPGAADQPGAYDWPGAYNQPGGAGQPGGYGPPGAYEASGGYGSAGAGDQLRGFGAPGGYGSPAADGRLGGPAVYRVLRRSPAVVVGLILATLLSVLDIAALAILVARPDLSSVPRGELLPVAASYAVLAMVSLVAVVVAWRGSRVAAWTVLILRVVRVVAWVAWSLVVKVEPDFVVYAAVSLLAAALVGVGLYSRASDRG
ncbi:protein kinase [Spirillospora sp. NPDC048911]|uniref:serine/threonine-protein kinase n=1 Tax=Spirillospora sp. NPDC048911 TaxID=3364527 RepID=UPI00371F87A9